MLTAPLERLLGLRVLGGQREHALPGVDRLPAVVQLAVPGARHLAFQLESLVEVTCPGQLLIEHEQEILMLARSVQARAQARRRLWVVLVQQPQLPIHLGRLVQAAELLLQQLAPPREERGRRRGVEGFVHQVPQVGRELVEARRLAGQPRELVQSRGIVREQGRGSLQAGVGLTDLPQLRFQDRRGAREQEGRLARGLSGALGQSSVEAHQAVQSGAFPMLGMRLVHPARGALHLVEELIGARRQGDALRHVGHGALAIEQLVVQQTYGAQDGVEARLVAVRRLLPAIVDVEQLVATLRPHRELLRARQRPIVVGHEARGTQHAIERLGGVARPLVEERGVSHQERRFGFRSLRGLDDLLVDLGQPRPGGLGLHQVLDRAQDLLVTQIQREGAQHGLEATMGVFQDARIHVRGVSPAPLLRVGIIRGLRHAHVEVGDALTLLGLFAKCPQQRPRLGVVLTHGRRQAPPRALEVVEAMRGERRRLARVVRGHRGIRAQVGEPVEGLP